MTARTERLALLLVVAALAAGCLLGIVHLLCVIGLRVPFDPNEGWNAYFAQMAMTRGTPYPAEGGLLVNNYPPLSFYLVGEWGKLVGDDVIAGRTVSLLAMIVVALGIGDAARRMGCNKMQSAFAGLLFVASIFLTSDYAGMNDPQLLGHAIAVWGLVVVLRAPRTPRALVLAALIFTLAFFVKHNLILLPVSLSAWLLLIDRRHATTFIASGAIFLLIGAGVFREIFGTSFFHQIASARTYDLHNIRAVAQTWIIWAIVPIGAALLLLTIARRDKLAVLAMIYASVSVLGGLLFLCGSGVDANALFDASIALSICSALLLDRLENNLWSAGAAAACVLPLLLLLRTVEGDWTSSGYWLRPMAENRIAVAGEISLLKRSREPALCEMLALCYWAGKSPQVDVFNTDQRIRTGALRSDGLVHLIAERRYSIIQLESLHPFPLPTAIERAVLQNYRIVRTDDERVFLVPR